MNLGLSHALKGFIGIAVLVVALIVIEPFAYSTKVEASPCKNCNVILIMVDTLAAKHLKVYGYARDTMPRTEAFFKEHGTIFMHAYSQTSWTLPSFNSLFFSDVPTDITYADLDNGRPRLQSAIRDAGKHVRGLIIPPTFFITETIKKSFKDAEVTDSFKEKLENLNGIKSVFPRWESEAATSSIPYFGFIHSFRVHDPYAPDPADEELFELNKLFPSKVTLEDLKNAQNDKSTPEEKQAIVLRYDQTLRGADAKLGAFFDSLSPETLAHTVIIMAADHGEAFGEHGLYWHGNSLFDELLHVPLFVYIPGVAAKTVSEPVGLYDIAPTVLDIMGVPIPKAFKGSSLLPAIEKGSDVRLAERIMPFEHGQPFYTTGKELINLASQAASKPPLLEDFGAVGSTQPLISQDSYGVRKGALKMVHSAKGLAAFDTEKDPEEKYNLLSSLGSLDVPTLFSLGEMYLALEKLKL